MIKLYFATDDALVVLTTEDGNAHCGLHLEGNKIGCVAVDPLCPQLVYCGTLGSGLWRSDDAGESWRPAGKGVGHSKVQAVTVSRSERVMGRGIVYAGTEPSAIFRSEDAGQSWRESGFLTTLPSAREWSFPPRPETHHVRWIQADPHAQGRLFVAIEAGALIRSPDSGSTWQDRTPNGPRDTHQLLIHPSAPAGCIRRPAMGISRVAMAAIHGDNSKKVWGTDISGVSPSIRRIKIISSFQQQRPRGALILNQRNHISIGAPQVRSGRSSATACPSRLGVAPQF